MIDTKHLIDVRGWGEFKVGDYFTQERGKEKAPKQNKDGDCLLIQETNSNNGFDRLVQPTVIFKGNAITISINYASNVFYQKDDFCASVNIAIIRNDNLNLYNGYFIASVLSSAHRKFDYQNKISKELIDDEIIKLPATSDGKPDWDYMESYMKAVMEESEKSLENLKKADDTKHLIDVSGWGEFDVIKFFTVLSGRAKLSNADIDDGDTPVYSSNSTNGGIFGYTTKSPDYEVNDENPFYITFGDHTKAVNIADKSFCVMDNVKVLTSNISNYNVLHFIITSWLRNVPDLGYARHWSKAEKAKIWLPITSTGKPDWQYMEDYMRNIIDKSEQIVSSLQIGA